jgi:hypothetical protein
MTTLVSEFVTNYRRVSLAALTVCCKLERCRPALLDERCVTASPENRNREKVWCVTILQPGFLMHTVFLFDFHPYRCKKWYDLESAVHNSLCP